MKKPKIYVSLAEKRAFFKRVKKLGLKVLKYYKWFFKANGWSRFILNMNNRELKLLFDQVQLTKGKKYCFIAA